MYIYYFWYVTILLYLQDLAQFLHVYEFPPPNSRFVNTLLNSVCFTKEYYRVCYALIFGFGGDMLFSGTVVSIVFEIYNYTIIRYILRHKNLPSQPSGLIGNILGWCISIRPQMCSMGMRTGNLASQRSDKSAEPDVTWLKIAPKNCNTWLPKESSDSYHWVSLSP